jgi:hypothetical protein
MQNRPPTRATGRKHAARHLSATRRAPLDGTRSGREHARPLHARTPDPRANHTRGSRCPRRCAPCSWTRRCAGALSCDRRSTGSASGTGARRRPWCGVRARKRRAAHMAPMAAPHVEKDSCSSVVTSPEPPKGMEGIEKAKVRLLMRRSGTPAEKSHRRDAHGR